MRKFKLLASLLCLLAALVACGESTTPTSGTGGTTATNTTTGDATAASPTTGAAAPTATIVVTPMAGGGNLEAIKARGKLIVGVKYDVPLYGFLNPETNKVEGFDVEIARMVAARIFGNPDAIEFKEAISKNRIPYLFEETVDVVFSTMTANEERAQQIDFSDCYYVAGQSLLVPVDSAIASIADLDGKTVGTVKASTSEKNIREKSPGAKVELFDTYSEAVQAMQAGRVDAVTTDDIILFGFQKNSPDKFKVVGGQFTQEPYAAGVKKGNTSLLNEVNATIRDMKQSGGWATLYKQFIGQEPAAVPPQEWRDVYKK
jgi:putative glutamine transport system substrate-binding protein